MKLSVRDDSQNYAACIVLLPAKQKVDGLDNLVKVTVFGNDCLVSKDSAEDVKYIFFPAGAQLSEDFAKYNNLYREFQLNSDPSKKGFFELNRRVKAVKFRGVTSTGFVIPVTALEYLQKPLDLKVGEEFTDIDGVEICRKYVAPGPMPGMPGAKGDRESKINTRLTDLMVKNQFRFHSETAHLAKNLGHLDADDIVLISDKWHGSSCILSKVLIRKKLGLWSKLLRKLGAKIADTDYGYIYSSGKPKSNLPKGIEGEWINDGPDYYISNIWKKAMDDYRHALEDGISIYGELVGFTENGQHIQKGYDYGCIPFGQKGVVTAMLGDGPVQQILTPGFYRFVVYRITYTKPDGNVIEFSWPQIKAYCEKYELEYAKEFFYGSLRELLQEHVPSLSNPHLSNEDHIESLFISLQNSYNMEKNCIHCRNDVPAEGVVLRIDSRPNFAAYKLKAKAFTKKESDDMDNGEVDTESIQ